MIPVVVHLSAKQMSSGRNQKPFQVGAGMVGEEGGGEGTHRVTVLVPEVEHRKIMANRRRGVGYRFKPGMYQDDASMGGSGFNIGRAFKRFGKKAGDFFRGKGGKTLANIGKTVAGVALPIIGSAAGTALAGATGNPGLAPLGSSLGSALGKEAATGIQGLGMRQRRLVSGAVIMRPKGGKQIVIVPEQAMGGSGFGSIMKSVGKSALKSVAAPIAKEAIQQSLKSAGVPAPLANLAANAGSQAVGQQVKGMGMKPTGRKPRAAKIPDVRIDNHNTTQKGGIRLPLQETMPSLQGVQRGGGIYVHGQRGRGMYAYGQ